MQNPDVDRLIIRLGHANAKMTACKTSKWAKPVLAVCQLLVFLALFSAYPKAAFATGAEVIESIKIEGNSQVESEAIIVLLRNKVGNEMSNRLVAQDIRNLFQLGYFSNIEVSKRPKGKGIELVIKVEEKPAIVAIEYEGLEAVGKTKVEEKLETKIYTIVNEETIAKDVRMIEQLYVEDGYYLARVSYKLDKSSGASDKEVKLTFQIDEGGKVKIADIYILGNEFFSDLELIDKLGAKPHSRPRTLASSSLYQDAMIDTDLQRLSYLYRDNGFAEVKVGKPIVALDPDRQYVRVTYKLEEGVQYRVNTIDVAGDLLFTKQELYEKMLLKSGDLFRLSRFQKDVEMLGEKYGDLGYAYADVNPVPVFNKEKKLVDITYNITKGEKVYFSEITIVGNSKTRDNVIRREMDVNDTELYSGTKLTSSKQNINRLGFFEEVQVIKERDQGKSDLLNLKIKVKEKPTGQLQAAVGFSPDTGGTGQSNVFGQGRYDERNQFGKGWATNLTGRWNGGENFSFDSGFSEPRINDGPWSLGLNAFYRAEATKLFEDVTTKEINFGGTVRVGKEIYKKVRASVAYTLSRLIQKNDFFLLDRFKEEGITSAMTFSLRRNDTDSYLEPTEGSDVVLSQSVAGGTVLRGDFNYMESALETSYFYPVDFSDEYRTYFRLHGELAYVYPNGEDEVPFIKRYRLGGYNDLRGYEFRSVSPKFKILRAPGDLTAEYPKGGDKKLMFQLEYFFPFFPEAGIKGLFFSDIGRVYDDFEKLEMSGFKYDVGFGFRWITPLAPFRFEWAYPLEDNALGDPKIIFSIGF